MFYSPSTPNDAAATALSRLPSSLKRLICSAQVLGLLHSQPPSSQYMTSAARSKQVRKSDCMAVVAHASIGDECVFGMSSSSVFFAPKGYTTGFKDHVPT